MSKGKLCKNRIEGGVEDDVIRTPDSHPKVTKKKHKTEKGTRSLWCIIHELFSDN